MVMTLLYWHWIIVGFVLMALEVILPSFITLWFGSAALIIGALLFFMPDISVTAQIFTWSILSITITFLWFKYLRPLSIDKTKAGLGREALLGQCGMVIQLPIQGQKGKLRLPAPILGNDEWLFIITSANTLALGDKVRIIDISGNSLIVEAL